MRPALKKGSYSKQGTTIFAIIFALMAILGLMSIMSPDTAEEASSTETLHTPNTYTGYLLRVVVVTITMIVVLIVGLKIYNKQMKLKGKNSLNLNVMGRHYINDKQYLLKVNIEDRNLLLGVTESNISLITELESMVEDDDQEAASFGTILDLETNKETRV